VDYWKFRTDMLEQVKMRFDAEQITIPLPQREVTLRNVVAH
jgi:small-conductance mechanosensitive channel